MLTNCPDFQIQEYKVDPYLDIAAQLQNRGVEFAIQTLINLAENQDNHNKIILLCRMLFERRKASEFRRPFIGNAQFFGDTNYSDWPLEPIEITNGIPFLIVRGYSVAGRPEPASSYLAYCIDRCSWSEKRYKTKSAVEKQTAVNSLIASSKWKKPLSAGEIDWFFSQTTV